MNVCVDLADTLTEPLHAGGNLKNVDIDYIHIRPDVRSSSSDFRANVVDVGVEFAEFLSDNDRGRKLNEETD